MLTVLVLGLTTTTASAIDLRNEDSRDYTVRVTSSAMTKNLELNSMSMSIIVCVGQCSFYVPGVGKVKATGADVVRIKNGRMTRVPVPQVALP
ncbi:MAG: hypothetical protein EP329_21530 [Deltaproteobacteria bacterium]|nr:MAG: hypothetical protein EP329_21530 [Deltaproteobacteria bacterium]